MPQLGHADGRKESEQQVRCVAPFAFAPLFRRSRFGKEAREEHGRGPEIGAPGVVLIQGILYYQVYSMADVVLIQGIQ